MQEKTRLIILSPDAIFNESLDVSMRLLFNIECICFTHLNRSFELAISQSTKHDLLIVTSGVSGLNVVSLIRWVKSVCKIRSLFICDEASYAYTYHGFDGVVQRGDGLRKIIAAFYSIRFGGAFDSEFDLAARVTRQQREVWMHLGVKCIKDIGVELDSSQQKIDNRLKRLFANLHIDKRNVVGASIIRRIFNIQ